ncbi:MAG: hypothetical protein KatS3mg111_1490 [Pirellulaceae bacterium]|nr:MAG: hypothetical protein KatS3mg111_1490 [Pirellulaceae bacterium]
MLGVVLIGHIILAHRRIERAFPVIDEIGHLAAGVSHWRFHHFDLYRVNPPLARLLVTYPVAVSDEEFQWTDHKVTSNTRPEFQIGIQKLWDKKLEIADLFYWPWWLSLVFYGLLISFCVRVGAQAGLPACVAWSAICPNAIAFSITVLPDVPAVAMGVLAILASWRYMRLPDCASAAWAGVALGAALLSKLTWITALVTLPLAALVCLAFYREFAVSVCEDFWENG